MTFTAKEFVDMAVKTIRKDSKKLIMPSAISSLAAQVPEMKPEELLDHLKDVAEDAKCADIELVTAFTGAKYAYSTKYIARSLANNLIRSIEMKRVVVDKVRNDSQQGIPTCIDVFPGLIPDLSKEELQACYAKIATEEQYRDIKSLTAFNGAVYYYSVKYLDQSQASRLARSAELQRKIIDKVRGDTKYLSQLTKMDTLLTLAPDLDLDEVRTAINELQKSERNSDIEVLTARNGAEYLFSQKHMTMSYAQILLRTAVNDPAYTIAETVREESRRYPRPTNIEIFKYGLFKIDREKLAEYVDQAMKEYEDLMYLDIDGSVFLYSNQFMTEEQAILVASRARREN